MARTPLLRSLRRLFAEHRAAPHLGLPVEALRERGARAAEAVRQGSGLFAGEHTSIDFQGFMEGGAEQGARAARELASLI